MIESAADDPVVPNDNRTDRHLARRLRLPRKMQRLVHERFFARVSRHARGRWLPSWCPTKYSAWRSFPFDRCRRLAGNIINHAIQTAYFVDDAVRDATEEIVGQFRPGRGHEIAGDHGAQRDNVIVGAAIAHHADAFYRQEHGEGLRNLVVPAHAIVVPGIAQFFDEDGIGAAQQFGVFALHFAEDAYAEAGAGEGVAEN